ncbi:olfactory receptor 52D1-like [Pelobates fuscus]|uniref:olfactory receptor 52D1-like n=1 Tax=Pelobates fuscus TaxID=191477 RepID=UPI002FE46E59
MTNYTDLKSLQLILGFGDMSSVRYFYSAIVLIGFMMIILYNGAVISVVARHKSLQEPMYIFISALCVNGIYGGASFLPNLFVNLLHKIQTISYIGCLTQVFCTNTYVGYEITLLAVMAFDRYACICNPLRYHSIMSMPTVFKLISAAWLYATTLITILVMMTSRLPLCNSAILKIYCDNWSVVRLSCVDTTANNIYGLFVTVALVGLMPLLIFMSYVEILKACAKSSSHIRDKALQTCTPHLISITVFVTDVFFEVLLYRFVPTTVPYELRVVMSVQILVVPPLLNPLMYGIKMKEIKMRLEKLFDFSSITAHKLMV